MWPLHQQPWPTLYPVQSVEPWSSGLIRVRHRQPGHLAEVLLERLLRPARGSTVRRQIQIMKPQKFITRTARGRTAHRSALTNTISNFWPDSLMVRYDSTRTRVKLRQGGHWKKTKTAEMKLASWLSWGGLPLIKTHEDDSKQIQQ